MGSDPKGPPTVERVDVIVEPDAMRAWSDERRAAGERIGFVPTMGALHDGHIALVDDAASRTDRVVVSIFVNPLQFDRDADLDAYPRPIDDDVAACRAAGVSAVYAPTAAAMYPDGFQTRVVPGALADEMEGPGRPGHFEGVVTVVTKLFAAVRPHVAIFGQKDFQQLRIIERLSVDLDLGVEIVGHPVVREHDGLAMSSRNRLLATQEREAAVCVPRSLAAAADAATAGSTVAEVEAAARRVVSAEPQAQLEYVTVFDPVTLRSLPDDAAGESVTAARIATAVRLGDVRLIDNRAIVDPDGDV